MKIALVVLLIVGLKANQDIDYEKQCYYKSLKATETLPCERLYITDDYKIKALFLAEHPNTDETLWIPFTINPKQEINTLTKEAMEKLRMGDLRNLFVLHELTFIDIGDENVLGMEYLRSCLMKINYTSNSVGLIVNTVYQNHNMVNWEMAMEDEETENKKEKLKKKYDEMMDEYNKKEEDIKQELEVYYDELKTLREKAAQLEQELGIKESETKKDWND